MRKLIIAASLFFGAFAIADIQQSAIITKDTIGTITAPGGLNIPTGNVGIATATPSEKLEVVGKVKASNFIDSGVTASTVPYFDASKQLTSSAVTPTQLSYLDATSSIQTQIDEKLTAPQITIDFYVDNGRNDSYTPDGSIIRPFKTINTALAACGSTCSLVFANSAMSYGALSINAAGITSLFIRGSTIGNVFAATFSTFNISNNDNLVFMSISNVAIQNTINLLGTSNNTGFCASGCYLSNVDLQNSGAFMNLKNLGFFMFVNTDYVIATPINITNAYWVEINGGTDGWATGAQINLVTDTGDNIPSGFDGTSPGTGTFLVIDNAVVASDITTDVNSAIQVRRGARVGHSGGTFTFDGDFECYNSFIRSDITFGASSTYENHACATNGTQSGAVTQTDDAKIRASTVAATTFTGALTGNSSTATALAANPTDCGSNTYATTIAANGNLTCAAITNASTTAVSTNTPSTIVLRDGSGNFSAGTVSAALTGNASTATALAANPTDCGSNTYATTIAASGDLTCASITNASTTAVSTNTNSTIVLRDGSGNFSAGTVTAALTGAASSNVLKAGDSMTGALSITTTSTPQDTLAYDGTNKLTEAVASNGFVTMTAAGSAPGFNLTGGSVGIGITPTSKLHVNGTLRIDSGQVINYNGAGAVNSRRFDWLYDANGVNLRAIDDGDTLAASLMTWKRSGVSTTGITTGSGMNVGDSTVNPTSFSGNALSSTTPSANDAGTVEAIGISRSSANDTIGRMAFSHRYSSGSTVWTNVAKIEALRATANDSSRLAFFTKAASASIGERMRIDESGNVGIGNTAPTEKLDLKNGHFRSSQTTAPVATVNANAGTGGTCALTTATDVAGGITLVSTAVAPSAGAQCSIAFNVAYPAAPHCQLTPTGANSALFVAADGIYITTTTTTLVINFQNADLTGRTFTWDYFCVAN